GGKGSAKVVTSNGGIRVTERTGELHLSTGNGPIVVRRATGRAELKTSNGPIVLQDVTQAASAQTSDGEIVFNGTLTDGHNRIITNNCRGSLALPANSLFRVEAVTSNGTIETDYFTGAVEGQAGHTVLRGAVGNKPAVAIKLETSNGPIVIRKKK